MLVYSGEAKDQANLFLSSRSSRSADLTGEGTGVLMSGSGGWTGQGVFGGVDREVKEGGAKEELRSESGQGCTSWY